MPAGVAVGRGELAHVTVGEMAPAIPASPATIAAAARLTAQRSALQFKLRSGFETTTTRFVAFMESAP